MLSFGEGLLAESAFHSLFGSAMGTGSLKNIHWFLKPRVIVPGVLRELIEEKNVFGSGAQMSRRASIYLRISCLQGYEYLSVIFLAAECGSRQKILHTARDCTLFQRVGKIWLEREVILWRSCSKNIQLSRIGINQKRSSNDTIKRASSTCGKDRNALLLDVRTAISNILEYNRVTTSKLQQLSNVKIAKYQ